ncbi:heterogeneous nuclear ribonucleoprotein A3 [Puntigrus tetrazona]|uniref:heterogeneous nuclear ribonucleoprotein A3 n=1 Tax=Puntigrus tetrazona TaxID=1606681 RepID=UPI001C8915B2|nr:heterogeneous nuclear ribonucleoprotein A3 [Puntigrus tetrazona]XP_043089345.1 heterogeneous nuclear ribonucleoprotein A3 [Puntigrus tetrazona]
MESSQHVYIHLPDKYKEFQTSGEWDHGIVVRDLNPYLTDTELHSYFEKFGTITECLITMDKSSGWPKGVGFVRYSCSEEAKAAEEAGPHYFGGFLLQIIKVVTPKMSAQNKFDNQLSSFPRQSVQTDLCVS